jgi:uncharacterized protein (DUF433 family)
MRSRRIRPTFSPGVCLDGNARAVELNTISVAMPTSREQSYIAATNFCPMRLFGSWSAPGHGSIDMLEAMAPRITIEPGKRSGQPCVRGLRITAWDVLTWLASSMTEQQILADYPELQPDDFPAVYEFAARMGRRVAL